MVLALGLERKLAWLLAPAPHYQVQMVKKDKKLKLHLRLGCCHHCLYCCFAVVTSAIIMV
jgi:hypothetical protein